MSWTKVITLVSVPECPGPKITPNFYQNVGMSRTKIIPTALSMSSCSGQYYVFMFKTVACLHVQDRTNHTDSCQYTGVFKTEVTLASLIPACQGQNKSNPGFSHTSMPRTKTKPFFRTSLFLILPVLVKII